MKHLYQFCFLILLLPMQLLAQQETEITLMSYNIKGGAITGEKVNNIAKIINYYCPDIVALQEVHKRPYLVFHDYLKDIADATGMEAQFFPLVSNYYGIGLLSTQKPISIQTQSFPFTDSSKDKEDRGIIIAEFPDFYFISTHYSLNATDRDTATKWLCNFAAYTDKTVFIAGDFNAQPTYRAMVTFKNYGYQILNNTNIFTFSATNPTQCIDMVLSYSDFPEAKKYEVTESGIATTPGVVLSETSDHLPIYVNIKPLDTALSQTTSTQIQLHRTEDSFYFSGLKEDSNLSIYHLNGVLIQKMKVTNLQEINRSNISAEGVYLLQLQNTSQYFTYQFINHY